VVSLNLAHPVDMKHKNLKTHFKHGKNMQQWKSEQCYSVSVLHNDFTIKQPLFNESLMKA